MATLLSAATATGAGSSVGLKAGFHSYQAYGTTSAGSGSATINIEVSNDASNWVVLGTITLTLGTSATTDGLSSIAAWEYTRANVTAISGIDASVTVMVS